MQIWSLLSEGEEVAKNLVPTRMQVEKRKKNDIIFKNLIKTYLFLMTRNKYK